MNMKKIFVLLLMLILYVNYVMHFKKDVTRLEKKIINIDNRIEKEEKLSLVKGKYKDINSSIDYTYLFYKGEQFSYSETMGMFQQDIQSSVNKTACTTLNIQWQDMPISKERWYNVLSLKLSLMCKPHDFIAFVNDSKSKSKLFTFNQLKIFKDRRKDFLRISFIVSAYRSKQNEN